MTATAIRYARTFLRWLLELPAPRVLRGGYATARGEVWAACDCLRRAERYLTDEEAAGRL